MKTFVAKIFDGRRETFLSGQRDVFVFRVTIDESRRRKFHARSSDADAADEDCHSYREARRRECR